jgi:gluconate kinase
MSAQLQLSKPHMLVVVGIPGAGKSFFATHFSDLFSAPYVDYDLFYDVAGSKSDELADYMMKQVIKTKQTLVIDGRGMTVLDRGELVKSASKNGYNILFVWVQTEPVTAEQRSTGSKTAKLSADQFVEQFRKFENLKEGEPYLVISGKHTSASQSRAVLKKLAAPHTVSPSEILRRLPYRNLISR